MNKNIKFKNIANITSGFFHSLEGVKNQSKQIFRSKIEAKLKGFDLVNREEFEELKAIIIKAREHNIILEEKIRKLENKIKKL
ncbi:MAG: hypothetical protein CBC22_06780 [Alphaproteobacteria bacterium TMED62]|nr:MAG: hypothetical protein CBC22_06780 [Alphaproteobacteria bacterium TMED62]|tara:strand:- start:4045 stop:4293 length:249 start_codon:yes stop_codon:yes gene_type:complete